MEDYIERIFQAIIKESIHIYNTDGISGFFMAALSLLVIFVLPATIFYFAARNTRTKK